MPYNPGIQYRGDAYLAQGISGAGDALAKGLEKFTEERKQAKAVETALGAVGSAVQHMVKQQVLPPDFLAKFQAAASGTTEQKRAALESVGAVLKFADQAQTMQAREQEMKTRGAEETRAAGLYAASQAFPQALGRELAPRTLPAMQVPGVSGYAGRPGAPMAGPVQLPAQTTTPEFDAGAIARAAAASNAPMLPQQAINLLGTTELADYRRGSLDVRRQAVEQRRALMGGFTPAQLDSKLKHYERLAADPFTSPDQKADWMAKAAEVRAYMVENGLWQPGGGPTTEAPAQGGKVRVVSPDGKTGWIPANQLEDALKEGYQRAK